MGGISGFLQSSGSDALAEQQATLERMAASLRHRGPDSGGSWFDAQSGLGLAHRHLARSGPLTAGRQPPRTACSRYRIIFDGAIYNCSALAADLGATGAVLQSHADAEVVLAAIKAWGLQHTLQRLQGMFAFVLWDAQERRLHLIRDRLGEKPLYYGRCGSALLFGSELKALRQHPAWSGGICRSALTQLLRHGYIPEPLSIYAGIYKLPPGSCLSVCVDKLPSSEALAPGGEQGPVDYWSVRSVIESGLRNPWPDTPTAAVDALEELLSRVIGQQMTADVPVGAFLSGGIDSSTVVALMQAQSARPLPTFTIGFSEVSFNEAEYAKAVARHLGTEHVELYVTAQDACDVIPQLPQVYDEPFANPSQIPMLLISQMARRQVNVALSGDGGDELFAGYNRYLWTDTLWSRQRATPRLLRAAAAGALSAVPAPYLDKLFKPLQRVLPFGMLQQPNLGGKLHKLASALRAGSATELYHMLMSYWQEPNQVVLGTVEPSRSGRFDAMQLGSSSLIDKLMYWDLIDYLPGDNLVKLDRAAMSVGLEARLPLLDQRVVELAWRLPADLKVRAGQGKWLLRQLAYRHIPKELLERPKMGFSPPIGDWLRGSLREWGEDLLAPERLAQQGLLDSATIQQCWRAHQAGHLDAALPLWSVLMFQAWYAEHEQRSSPPRSSLAQSVSKPDMFSSETVVISSG